MGRICHFEIGAVDVEKIRKFYENVFDWKFNAYEGFPDYYVIETGDKDVHGINGGLFKSKGEAVVVNTIDVSNLDEMITKVEANNGKIEVAKMAIPNVGWLCYFKDVEGNLFGMMQNDANAK